jgi:Ser-tRNA(Ala) deacylase AlaX
MILTKNSTTTVEKIKPQRQVRIMIVRTAIHLLVRKKSFLYLPRNGSGSRIGP